LRVEVVSVKARSKGASMSVIGAVKRLGIMIGGIAILVALTSGAQFLIGHRIPDWLKAIATLLVALGAYISYVRLTERRPVDELAPAALLPETLLGLAIGVGLFATVIGLLALTGHYHHLGYGSVPGLLTAFLATLTGAVIEELLFRGFLFRVVQSIGGTWIRRGRFCDRFRRASWLQPTCNGGAIDTSSGR
jgi:membrane protease YdiL (CAAX protease family)